jgi:hypothetical protein
VDALSERMQALAVEGIRDFAATHQISFREARRRLDATAHAGRTRGGKRDDG